MRPFQLLQQSSVAPENYNHFVRPLWFFLYKTDTNKTNSGTFKKKSFASSLLQSSAPAAAWEMTVTEKKTESKKTSFFMHSIPSDSFGKAVIASLRPWRPWILPQRTAGSSKSLRLHPDGPLRLEPGCLLDGLLVSLFRLRCKIVVRPEDAGDVLLRPWRRSPWAGWFLTGSRRTMNPNDRLAVEEQQLQSRILHL